MSNSNTPFAQSAAEFQQLSQDISSVSDEISQTEQISSTLMNATDLAGEFQADLVSLSTALTELEESIDGQLPGAVEVVSGLKEKVDLVESQTVEATNQVKEQLATLHNQIQTNLTELQAQAEQTQAGFDQLVQQTQTFSEEVGEQLETVKENLSDFQELIDSVKSGFTDRKTALVAEFDTFEQHIREKLQSLTEGFTTLIDESTSQIEAVEQVLDTTSGETIAAINRKFVEEAMSELSRSAEDLNRAISGLGEIGETSKDLMEGEIGEVLDKVSEVTDLIKKIKPVLDLVKEML
jgi:uncharacterized phage infection (PIP) family protein YhgE